MSDFFKGWRRKVGCIALVMASVLAVGWAKSELTHDVFCWSFGERTEVLVSSDGVLSWWRIANRRAAWPTWNRNMVTRTPSGSYFATVGTWTVELGASDSLAIPYWTFAIPLMLFSGYLILWQPAVPRQCS